MGYYYEIYDAEHGFKRLGEGKFSGMPFYMDKKDMPVDFMMTGEILDSFFCKNVDAINPYNMTVLLGRKDAIETQKYMKVNQNIFTRLMDENYTDTLIIRIT